VLFFTNLLLFESVTSTSMSYFNIIKLNATPSTNDFLKEKHQKGVCQDGDLVWAKNQTSGRGQRDKMWISNPKDSLTFSVYKTYDHFPTTNNFLISMAVSLGIINALQSFNIPNLCIKWPNDIMADNKKIAGILIENIFKKKDLKASIIGIGININQTEFHGLPNATSLAAVINKNLDKQHVFDRLKAQLEKSLFSLQSISKETLISDYSSLLWKKDKVTVFEDKGIPFTAILRGVSPSGSLLLEDETGRIVEFNSGEIKMDYEN